MNYKRLILRHGTLDEMKSLGYPVLLRGEPFVEIDSSTLKLKIGDGTSKYDELKYVSSGYSSSVPSGGGSGTGSYIEVTLGQEHTDKDIQDKLSEAIKHPVVGASYVCLKDESGNYYWLYYVEDIETVGGEATLVRKWKDKPQYMLHNVFNTYADFNTYITLCKNKMNSTSLEYQDSIFLNDIIAVNRKDDNSAYRKDDSYDSYWDIAICKKISTLNAGTTEYDIDIEWLNEITSNNIKYEYITKITNFLIGMDITNGGDISNLDVINSNLGDTKLYNYKQNVNIPINIGDYATSFNDSLNALDITIEDSKLDEGVDNTYDDNIITTTLAVGPYYVQVALTVDTYKQNKYYIKNSDGEYVLSAEDFSKDQTYYEKKTGLEYNDSLTIDENSFTADAHVSLLEYLRKIMSEIIRILSENDRTLADDLYKKYIMTTTMLVEYAKRLNNYTKRLNALETTVTDTLNNINTSLNNILNGVWQPSNT